jgi:uroporphyrinogen decarboxylase
MPLERYAFDAAIVFADLMSPASALGIDFTFEPGPVVAKPLRSAADIRALPRPGRGAIAPEVIETLRRAKAQLGGRAALIGFGGAPWSLAAYLVEGRSAQGFPRLRALLHADPVAFGELMERLAELVIAYLLDQHEAGADVVQLFDSWAGLLPVEAWTEHVLPHVRAVLQATRAAGVPTIYFPRGAPQAVDAHLDLPCDGLALCSLSDLGAVRARAPAGLALQGNLDPTVLLAGPAATTAAARALLAGVPARGHIVNLGHGLHPETPLESVAALIEVVHAEATKP